MSSLILTMIYIFVTVVPLIVAIAFFTLAERKVMAAMQRRSGPNIVGFWGLLQPMADGLKLMIKEWVLPSKSLIFIYLLAPFLTFFLALISWAVIPFSNQFSLTDLNLGILYLYAVSSMGIFGVMLSGWSSNSKYAFLGSLSSTAQMISYEVSIGLIFVVIGVCSGSLNILSIVYAQQQSGWFFLPLFPLVFIFFVSMLAETNSAPFDLPEAEAELVAGFNVEYSSITFALFFLGEYCNMILMASLMVILFFGGWLSPIMFLNFIPVEFMFSMKLISFCMMFMWVRASFPRYSYDQLMFMGWKIFLPFNLAYLWFVVGVLYWANALPVGDFFYNWGLLYDQCWPMDTFWSSKRIYRNFL